MFIRLGGSCFFFIHAKLKINCVEEGTEWHSLGKLPLDFIENQEDGEAQQLEQKM